MNTREKCLKAAIKLVNGDRQEDYGDLRQNFENIAGICSVIVGKELTVQQAALLMIAVKMARLITNPQHRDSVIDIAGYAALLAELNDEN